MLRKFQPNLENLCNINSEHVVSGESVAEKNLNQEQKRKLVESILYGIRN